MRRIYARGAQEAIHAPPAAGTVQVWGNAHSCLNGQFYKVKSAENAPSDPLFVGEYRVSNNPQVD